MSWTEIRFGRFRLDRNERSLTSAGTPVKLGGRALDILCMLAEAKGEVVTKDDLMTRIWPDQVIEENALQAQVSALRRALGQDRQGESYIETVQGRGYRLLHLQPASGESETDQPSVPAAAGASVAVLPFANMSGDPEQEYFADGVVDDIITGLSRIRWLFVIARNSSFVYKGNAADIKRIGRELGARYVLEGSVRKANNRVRVTAQLIEAQTGVHLWAERYDRLLDDVFAVQDEIAMSVTGTIEPNLQKAEIERVRRKRPDNLDAYDLVLRALPLVNTLTLTDTVAAMPLLERALQLDPNYGAAHAALAWCYQSRFSRGGLNDQDRRAAVLHARAAVRAGGDDATTLATAALVIWYNEHNDASAFNLFDRALALSDSNVVALRNSAMALAWTGATEVAVERAQRALRLSPFDPLNYHTHNALAVAHFHASQYQDALGAARLAVESNPSFNITHAFVAAALVRLGRIAEAKAAAQRVLELSPDFTIRGRSRLVGHMPQLFEDMAAAWRDAGLPNG